MPHLHVHLLPALIQQGQLTNGNAVVIDVLRASTTIIHALAHGASQVIPCLTVDDARQQAAQFASGQALLGGERHGELIPGFDLDNSPLRYVPEMVRNKTVVFTTTNGTKALLRCREATQVFVGAFVNLEAVSQRLQHEQRDAHFVCAGTDGQLTAEDILFAGCAARRLLELSASWQVVDVQTRMTLDFAVAHASPEEFQEAFRGSLGARNLLELGMTADVDRCQQRDLYSIVPAWDAKTGFIRVA